MKYDSLHSIYKTITMSKEKQLRNRGFSFTGFYTRDKEKAKNEAARLRKEENVFACVLSKTYPGRIYSTEGFSVYSKPKDKTKTNLIP